MRLQEFMSRNVETVSPNDTLQIASQKMKLKNIHHLVVMDGRNVEGVLSERDIHGLSPKQLQDRRVEDVMSEHVVTARPDTTVREAANLLRGRSIGCLPIMDGHKLIGVITTTDLLDLLGQGIERVVAETDRRPLLRRSPATSSLAQSGRR